MKLAPIGCLLLGLVLGNTLLASTRIEVLGAVPAPGEKEIAEGLRLGDLISQLRVDPLGYWLGASWQSDSLKQGQQRLKAGVLFDLIQIERLAMLQNEPGLAAAAQRLNEQVSRLPITGRRLYRLDPLAVELNALHSPKLQGGDRLIFPPRPDSIRVTGAVSNDCKLPFAPLQQAYRYAQQCPALAEADPDYLYLIQPDGQVSRLGRALWNREETAPPAPGAILLIPLDATRVDAIAADLNSELARFIATQPLSMELP
ncbi:capsule biosynthesis GfcC family protein [Pseudomonas sp. BGr12]|uniref:capsule biosynthesis GfcC family protein n=1 Tax=unclassified Pseudomonas TaxID=196821 RepID=UPI00177EB7B0|nr:MULTISPECIES: capsule biosynthesis GfcC family protein [unclassified Pseudomonas]MBD9503593.1 capsule biosynthesis GfcC family protein [Pseudomonas sp. PDM17]MBD9574076.1 capsule biosynthesis GfcC family protein [Pseudomonas sp. PDM23]MBD9671914.1 capsule biosynthesis GfcC family protein [Pseudomonas sp. PDM21]MDL2425536.1 capsule biosynthesis GfcC family protein [Pseudomonas sp. BJa5]